MEVQGSADEIVPNMLAFLREQTAVARTTAGEREGGATAASSTAEVTITDEDRDL